MTIGMLICGFVAIGAISIVTFPRFVGDADPTAQPKWGSIPTKVQTEYLLNGIHFKSIAQRARYIEITTKVRRH